VTASVYRPNDASPGRRYPAFMPGNIGWQGLVVILIILLLVFGPKRLPEMGRSLGRGMREFKDSVTGRDDDDRDRQIELTPGDDTQPVRTTTTSREQHDA
jgi:sec-independent protein translocase protein TatA